MMGVIVSDGACVGFETFDWKVRRERQGEAGRGRRGARGDRFTTDKMPAAQQ